MPQCPGGPTAPHKRPARRPWPAAVRDPTALDPADASLSLLLGSFGAALRLPRAGAEVRGCDALASRLRERLAGWLAGEDRERTHRATTDGDTGPKVPHGRRSALACDSTPICTLTDCQPRPALARPAQSRPPTSASQRFGTLTRSHAHTAPYAPYAHAHTAHRHTPPRNAHAPTLPLSHAHQATRPHRTDSTS